VVVQELAFPAVKTRVAVEDRVVGVEEQVLAVKKETVEVVEVWGLMMGLCYLHQNCFL